MQHTIDVDGRSRSFTLVEPEDGRPDGSRDLILVLHGSKQDGAGHRRFTGGAFDALAVRDGALVAYLDGYRGNWNDARRESRFPARVEGVDDVGFVRAVVDLLVGTRHVDRRRVFAVGYSNGGQMVLRLAHEAPAVLAGAAVVAATLPDPGTLVLTAPDPDPAPIPVVLVHGTGDPIVPYGGGTMSWWARALFKVGGTALSMPDTARYFAARNGITAAPSTAAVGARGTGRTRVERTEYRQPGLPPVVLYTVRGGGHTVPGPTAAPRVLGRTATDVSTADLIREAFGIGGAPR